jgi:hypothetical protein
MKCSVCGGNVGVPYIVDRKATICNLCIPNYRKYRYTPWKPDLETMAETDDPFVGLARELRSIRNPAKEVGEVFGKFPERVYTSADVLISESRSLNEDMGKGTYLQLNNLWDANMGKEDDNKVEYPNRVATLVKNDSVVPEPGDNLYFHCTIDIPEDFYNYLEFYPDLAIASFTPDGIKLWMDPKDPKVKKEDLDLTEFYYDGAFAKSPLLEIQVYTMCFVRYLRALKPKQMVMYIDKEESFEGVIGRLPIWVTESYKSFLNDFEVVTFGPAVDEDESIGPLPEDLE